MSWNMIGHEWAAALLPGHLRRERLRQAYLISGPPSSGRRTLAVHFAQAINCPQPSAPGEPCLTCRTCLGIERMSHPDLFVVQSELPGGTLKVEQVRSLQHDLALSPYEARYRIAILLRFEEAHPGAANALLKVLEEPPAQVILLLTASSSEELLPTIISRCELIPLRPVPEAQVSAGLQSQLGLSPERADLLAHLSGGRPGYAITLEKEPEKFEQRNAWLGEMLDLLTSDRVERFRYSERLAKDKALTQKALQTWLLFWRDIMLRASGATAPLINLDREAEIDQLAVVYGMTTASRVVHAIEKTMSLVDKNVNARLATENLMLVLPFRA